jgi:AraC-like DNA-binding protein
MTTCRDNFFCYLPITEKSIQWDLYVTGGGFTDIIPHTPYPPPGHPTMYKFSWDTGRVLPEYQVLYISRGRGQFESTDIGLRTINSGDFILLFPGAWHRYRPCSKTGWREHWVSFNGEYLYRLQKRGVISPEHPIRHLWTSDKILEAYNQIFEAISTHRTENSYIIAAFGMQVLAAGLESSELESNREWTDQPSHKVEDSTVAMAIEWIWKHSHLPIGVDHVAELLPVTRRTLERQFRKVLNRSISEEITLSRIARTKHLLVNTHLPIENIALTVGFSGADRLGKIFRRWEKITPGAYRKRRSI